MTRRMLLRGGAGSLGSAYLMNAAPVPVLDAIAECYIKLALAVGVHDKNYIDVYTNRQTWREDAGREKAPLDVIRGRALELIAGVKAFDITGAGEMLQLRREYLLKQLESMVARVDMLGGKKMKFDEESAVLYGAVAPKRPASHFQELLDQLDPLLPGKGTVAERYTVFSNQFLIPPAKLDAVFQAAIREARKRTKLRIKLPEVEDFIVKQVTGKSWTAYNWFQGDAVSIIEVNRDLPQDIGSALHVACHEGYPGHHVYNCLIEERLMRWGRWFEYSVYPLYSPQSLISEGTADFGADLAFPSGDRVKFNTSVLFPIAGIPVSKANVHEQVRLLTAQLEPAGIEAARGYLDGELTKQDAIDWLMRYTLASKARAGQRIRFIDENRSYIINYTHGKDLVRNYLSKRGATMAQPDKLWEEFERLLASPRLASGL